MGKRVHIPDSETLKLEIAGHQGILRTRGRVTRLYYWPGMEQDIRKYVRSCTTCQRHSERNSLLAGKLHPLPIPQDRFRDLSIDFATVSPSKEGFDSLMVIVCRLSKLCRLIPCHRTCSAADVAKLFIDNWYGTLTALDYLSQLHRIETQNLHHSCGKAWQSNWASS